MVGLKGNNPSTFSVPGLFAMFGTYYDKAQLRPGPSTDGVQ